MSQPISRRHFIKTTSAAAGAGFAATMVPGGGLSGEVSQATSDNLEKIFEGLPVTDQYGNAFDVSKVVGGKPCIVLFGFSGCKLCGTQMTADEQKQNEGISATIASIQQRLMKEGMDVPIVVVSVKPELDKPLLSMESYTAAYYAAGVRQLSGEKLNMSGSDAVDAYYAAQTAPADKRLLHIVAPETQAQSVDVVNRINQQIEHKNKTTKGKTIRHLLFDPQKPSTHSSWITLFDGGELIDTFPTLSVGKDFKPLKGAAADKVLRSLKDLKQSHSPTP